MTDLTTWQVLLDLGYIKYTLVNESTQRPLFLWRRPTQRPVIRDGYGPMI